MITYILKTGANTFLFNYTVSVVDPSFVMVLTNPWTDDEKTAYVTPEGVDGAWDVTLSLVAESYEDLFSGEVYMEKGTWDCSIYLNDVSSLITEVKFQVV